MPFDRTTPGFSALRITLQDHEVTELMQQYPLLSRTEICDVIKGCGPMRGAVESELSRLSGGKGGPVEAGPRL
jgi:hypothetical protein